MWMGGWMGFRFVWGLLENLDTGIQITKELLGCKDANIEWDMLFMGMDYWWPKAGIEKVNWVLKLLSFKQWKNKNIKTWLNNSFVTS